MRMSFGKIIVASALFFFYTDAVCQNYNFNWDKTYGGDSRDWNSQIVKAADGSLFLIGDSQSDTTGNKTLPLCSVAGSNGDVWLMKIDTSGNIQWQNNLGGESDERNPQLIPLNNPAGELLFACHSTSDIACDKTGPNRDTIPLLSSDYWICLLDASGNKLWDVTLGGDNYDDYTRLAILSGGEILVSGESNSPVSGDKTVPNYTLSNDLWTLRLNASGSIVWDKVFGGDAAEYLASVITLPNDEFVLAGTTLSDISGDVSEATRGSFDFWMIKVDGSGNKIWDKRYGGSDGDRCLNAVRTPDNGFLLSGYTVSPISGEVTTGNKMWDKRYGGSDGSIASFAEPALGGGYWIGGTTDSDSIADVTQSTYGGSDYWIIRTDNNGTKLWDRRFGGTSNEFFTSFTQLADSSLMLFGYSDTGTSPVKTATSYGWYDYWMVKFKYSDTTSTGLNDEVAHLGDFLVYPNPSNGIVTLNYTTPNQGSAVLFVRDLTGKELVKEQLTMLRGSNNHTLNLAALSSGVYFLELVEENGSREVRQFMVH
jgi:hypothetical protein